MEMFKKCKVFALNTNSCTKLVYSETEQLFFIPVLPKLSDGNSFMHLYFLSDDEIKEGDYVYDGKFNLSKVTHEVYKWTHENWIETPNFEEMEVYKIIASTDTTFGLPLINPNFIKNFVNSDGIDEVLVKYENKIEELDDKTNDLYNLCNIDENIYDSKYYDEYKNAVLELNNYKPTIVIENDCVVFKLLKTTFDITELPIKAIKDCLRYCETQPYRDKLNRTGDFYNKLNKFINDNNL